MTLSGESSAASSASSLSTGGLAQQHHQKVLELEKQLVASIHSKGPFDPNVRILRSRIRELFEAIILEDHEFADLHDVEQSLWRLHHTRIEEFRARYKKSLQPAGLANPPTLGNRPSIRREPVQKILAAFRSFLSEATGFYHDLILKIRAKYGLSQDDPTCSAINGKVVKGDDKRMLEMKRCQLSCHRCLIYLGDLARYKEFYGAKDAKKGNWAIAAGFYVKAASMWPASGNPYNQLAVLATYVGDEMLAVYHYFRSLASESPFLTAKDNLVLLFEKNLHTYLRLVSSPTVKPAQASKLEIVVQERKGGETEGTTIEENGALHSPNSEKKSLTADILKSFRVRVVRLNGILFARTSLETFAEVHSCALSELEELLNVDDPIIDEDKALSSQVFLTSGRIWGIGPNVLLQLVCILIFTVHNTNLGPGPDSHQPTYAEILQRPVVLEHSFIAMFECVGYIVRRCAQMDDPSSSMLLPAVLVVMEWLSCRPEMAVGTDIKEKEGNARQFFWKNCVNLFNKLLTGAFGGVAANDDDKGLALWEDFELLGFTPLLPIQHHLDYNTPKPAAGLGSSKEKCVRVGRLKHAGKVMCDMFHGTDKGIHYDAETDMFYMGSDKKRSERKQAAAVLLAETPEAHCGSVKEPKDVQTVADPVSILTKVATSLEDEDEEVIVFEPSNKMKKLIDPTLLDGAVRDGKDSLSFVSEAWVDDKRIPVSQPYSTATEARLPIVSSLSSSSVAHRNNQAFFLTEPTSSADGASNGSGAILAANSADMDVVRGEHSSHVRGPSLEGRGLREGGTKVTVHEYDHGLFWGSGRDFGMFQNQPACTSIPASVNWQPQDVKGGGSSLCNSEFHRLAAARKPFGVPPQSSTIGMVHRFPFMDPSPVSIPNTGFTNGMQKFSDALSMPSHSVTGNHVEDRLLQAKPCVGEPKLFTTEINMGTIQLATQDLSISGPKLNMVSGFPNESEIPARKTAPSSLSMRPPPGFGPLPVKPPLSLSPTSIAQVCQPTPSGNQPGPIGQQKTPSDLSGALPTEEHIDDYAWLDGYAPPKKELAVSGGLGGIVGSSSYGCSGFGFNPAFDATAAPFPGMKPFMGPPPQQPPLPYAFLQQELLRKQQTQEQYQQQLLQEHQRKQLQQLYNAQLAVQRNQLQQAEQQNQPQSIQQHQPFALQQQIPQPLWPGQNSFVS